MLDFLIATAALVLAATVGFAVAEWDRRDSVRYWIRCWRMASEEDDSKALRLSRIGTEMRRDLHNAVDGILDDYLAGFGDDRDDEEEDEDEGDDEPEDESESEEAVSGEEASS